MTDDVKIPISTPGAKQSQTELDGVASSLRKVGEEGKKGAAEAGKATDSLSKSTQNLTSQVGALLGGYAGFQGVVKMMRALADEMERITRDYQVFVNLTQRSDVRSLAQIRGKGEAETAAWTTEQAARYGVSGAEITNAAFEIESGFRPEQVGGAANLARMEEAAFKTMRISGVGGKTVAGLQIAAYESGLAKSPEQFESFLAKSVSYAGGSRINLQDFGTIMARLLPMAVSAGIDPDEFQSMAAAMSFRISNPGRLATSLEQLIRAAGAKSAPLEKLAAGGQLSASQIMAFQSEYLSGAMRRGGPQAATAAASELNISPELAQVYGVAFDPTVRARMGELRGQASGATFAGTVGGRFAAETQTPEGRASLAEYELEYQKQERARKDAVVLADLAEAKARSQASQADETNPLNQVLNAVVPDGVIARRDQYAKYREELDWIIDTSDDPATVARAKSLKDSIYIGGLNDMQVLFGVGQQQQIRDVATFLNEFRGPRGDVSPNNRAIYHGGTHYHSDNRNDPAGKPQPASVGR